MKFVEYDKATGRILRYGDEQVLREMLPAPEGTGDAGYYVRWDEVANGRPVNPKIVERVRLEARQAREPGRTRVEIPSDVAREIKIDGKKHGKIEPENGVIVIEFESPLPRFFTLEIDEPAAYLDACLAEVR